MEENIQEKPIIWKATKMFWFDQKSTEAERRECNFPSKIRVMIVNRLRDDNTMWYATAQIIGRKGDTPPQKQLEDALQNLDMATNHIEPQCPVTDEEFESDIEEQRKRYGGTWFDETSVPSAIVN